MFGRNRIENFSLKKSDENGLWWLQSYIEYELAEHRHYSYVDYIKFPWLINTYIEVIITKYTMNFNLIIPWLDMDFFQVKKILLT